MPAINAYRRPYGLRSSSARGGVLCLPVIYPPMAGNLAASPLDIDVTQDPSLSEGKALMCRDRHSGQTLPEVPLLGRMALPCRLHQTAMKSQQMLHVKREGNVSAKSSLQCPGGPECGVVRTDRPEC